MVARRSPWGTSEARRERYVRWSWIGYKATKKEDKTPATMDSHAKRMLDCQQATRRATVAIRAEARTENECFCWERMVVRRREMGTIPMRAR